jgi:hypothetical protein
MKAITHEMEVEQEEDLGDLGREEDKAHGIAENDPKLCLLGLVCAII